MARVIEALVKPGLLRWAREEASFTISEAARKASVREDALIAWEGGQARPSMPQLRKLANVYKRPLAVFYLPEAPPSTEPVKDFRRLPGDLPQSVSPALRLEIRKAFRRRDLALEILDDLGEQAPALYAMASSDDAPEAVGAQVRQLLYRAQAEQSKWRTDHEALNAWRTSLEGMGILVFQATGVALTEMLGFSISKNPLPVIVVNIKNHPRARIFSLMHEFVHLLLREGGICDLGEDPARIPETRAVEIFCNHAAGAALVPMDRLRDQIRERTPDEELITWLATRYHVGREVVARRMLIGGMVTPAFYQHMRQRFQKDFERVSKDQDIIIPPPTKALSATGRLFARLVIENYDEDHLTANDVTEYLGIRLKHLPRIREALRKSSENEERP
jgi:Zn-dependent peptidase ImmA (M78 family)/DNA-binding XRE family transcriptional regulator